MIIFVTLFLKIFSGSLIKIIDTNSERKKKLDCSFSGGVSSFSFSSCGCYLIASSSRGSRELLLFDIQADAELTPISVIPVIGLPMFIDIKSNTESELLEVLVLFEDKGGSIYQIHSNYVSLNESNKYLIKRVINITSHEEILSGYIGELNKSREDSPVNSGVVLATGKASQPIFKHYSIFDSDGNSLETIDILRQKDSKESNDNSNSDSKSLKAPDVIGPYDMGGIKRPLKSDGDDNTDQQEQNKRSRNDLSDSTIDEMTLEQRLESLSSSLMDLENLPPVNPNPFHTATSDSLVVLIEQALQSNDDSLLEQCISCGDIDIIDATTNRLPTNRIVTFLRKLVAKFEKRPSRGILVTRWLSSILRHHTSFLITVRDLSFQLAGLSQMLEQRLSSYSKLSSLAGRLDLLLSQVIYPSPSATSQPVIAPLHIHKEK